MSFTYSSLEDIRLVELELKAIITVLYKSYQLYWRSEKEISLSYLNSQTYKTGVDSAKEEGRFLQDSEAICWVKFHLETGVDVGMCIDCPGGDLESSYLNAEKYTEKVVIYSHCQQGQ